MDTGFGRYHPAVNFIFFLLAIVSGMFFLHPAVVVISMVASLLYYLLLRGRKGLKFIASMVLVSVIVMLLNPLLNQMGHTVLFTYFGGRIFTLEALLYGVTNGAMLLSVMLWFACYNQVVSSDKFLYLFGGLAPSVSLLLSMVLRLVPGMQKKAAMIAAARASVGKAPVNGTRKQQLAHSADILSVLTAWSLEGAIITADSMRSRGFGSDRRTIFSIYRFHIRDAVALGIMAVLAAVFLAGGLTGSLQIEFYPTVTLPDAGFRIPALLGYSALLLLPSGIHIWEELSWRTFRSKI